MKIVLYYIHDPMCSWCWGFSRILDELLQKLPEMIEVQRVLGGLAIDSMEVMPLAQQQQIRGNWKRIEEDIPGVKFNFDFWREMIPRRSTYPACRAVIAARLQGTEYDVLMTKSIQKAYYQQARNPSDEETLIQLAKELDLSEPQFKNDLFSEQTQAILLEEINLARELYAESFPSLILKLNEAIFPIKINYQNYNSMLDEIQKLIKGITL